MISSRKNSDLEGIEMDIKRLEDAVFELNNKLAGRILDLKNHVDDIDIMVRNLKEQDILTRRKIQAITEYLDIVLEYQGSPKYVAVSVQEDECCIPGFEGCKDALDDLTLTDNKQ